MKILITDDEYQILEALNDLLLFNKHVVFTAQSLEEAFMLLKENKFDLMILDMNFPKGFGLNFLEKIRQQHPWLPVIVISGNLTEDLKSKLNKFGVAAYLEKPFLADEVLDIIQEFQRNEQDSNTH